MRQAILHAFQGALSRGPGYEPHPRGDLVDGSGTAGYYIDYRSKVDTHDRFPNLPLQPADVAQLALGWHECALVGDGDAEAAFLGLCVRLRDSAQAIEAGVAWPYDVHVAKYPLMRPWYSGMAQGQIASVFVRAWKRTGDDSFGDLALAAIRPLLQSWAGLVTATRDGPVIEECGPLEPSSHILNGWIFGLWGVRDTFLALDDSSAERLASATTACLAASLPSYDTGWWSRYSLYPHALTDLAKPFYHRLHVVQLEVMHALTGADEFSDTAARWTSYDTRFSASRAIASKVPFAVVTRPRMWRGKSA